MNIKRNKINLHMATNDDGLYFWDRISFEKIQSIILMLTIAMACLPIFVSLTVKPWIYMLKGAEAAKNCFYMIVGEYWSSLIYILGAAAAACVLLGAAQKYKGCTIKSIAEKKWIYSHWLCVNLLLLFFWSVISFFQSKDREIALWGDYFCHEGLILYFFYAAFFLAGSWLTEKQMKSLAEVLVFVCAVAGLLSGLYELLPRHLIYLEDQRAVIFHHYNHYGYFLAICAPLAIGLYLYDKKPGVVRYLFRFLELWLIFNALAVNSTRGSFLALSVIAVCFNLYVFLIQKDLRKRMLLLDILFLLTFVLLNTGSQMFSRIMELFGNLQEITEAEDKQAAFDTAGSLRGVLWRNGLQFMRENPLFGYGPGGLGEPYARVESHTSSPHNDLILMGASLGIPAVIFYLSGLLGHLKGFLQHVKAMNAFEVSIYFSAGSYFLGSMTGVSIYYTAPYYFLLLGCSYGIYRRYRDRSSSEPEKSAQDVCSIL